MLEVPILFFNHQLNTFVKMNLVWMFFNQLLNTFVKMNCNSVGEGVELEELPQNLIELRVGNILELISNGSVQFLHKMIMMIPIFRQISIEVKM